MQHRNVFKLVPSCSIRLPLTLTVAVPDQLHVVGAVAVETQRLVHTPMRAAAIIDQTLVLICKKTNITSPSVDSWTA